MFREKTRPHKAAGTHGSVFASFSARPTASKDFEDNFADTASSRKAQCEILERHSSQSSLVASALEVEDLAADTQVIASRNEFREYQNAQQKTSPSSTETVSSQRD